MGGLWLSKNVFLSQWLYLRTSLCPFHKTLSNIFSLNLGDFAAHLIPANYPLSMALNPINYSKDTALWVCSGLNADMHIQRDYVYLLPTYKKDKRKTTGYSSEDSPYK